LYSNDVLLAGKTARSFRVQAEQNTENYKIDLIVKVSKGYYDVLLSQLQLKVYSEAIIRLERNLKDSYSQYQNGIADKIDYKRATIGLNNAKVDMKTTEESIKVKYANLRQLIGYPAEENLSLTYDTLQMASEIIVDTTQTVNYEDRIEYKMLLTKKLIQEANVGYYKWGFVPSLSAFGNYNIIYQNNSFPDLYDRRFPNSAVGLRLSVPLLEGSKRWQNLKKADLQYKRIEWDIINLKNQINAQYMQALASYKSNLAQLQATQQNEDIAREVYGVVRMQYNEGIKTYLDVIQSETDLRTAQVNNLNALFQVLSSKLDVQRALGVVTINN
jgi:outer membrane protein TolC